MQACVNIGFYIYAGILLHMSYNLENLALSIDFEIKKILLGFHNLLPSDSTLPNLSVSDPVMKPSLSAYANLGEC